MKNQLIGPEIVSLAEEDVSPDNLVFHKFYVNKMNSSKKPKKKKKKTADDEAAEELYGVDGDDENEIDNEEEIENVLDSANPTFEVDGDYNYDDLAKIANEDDDDLIGRGSDEEHFPSDIANMDEGVDEDIAIGEADDESDIDKGFNHKKKKQKSNKHSAASPFASLDDYQHLMDDSNSAEKTSTKKRSRKGKKKVS